MIDEHNGAYHGEIHCEVSPKLSRRSLLAGLFALPVVALDAGSAQAQYIGFGPFRLHLGPTGGHGGGRSYRTRRVPRHAARSGAGGGSRHVSRRGRRSGGGDGGAGGDNGGGSASSATGLGKADY